MKLGTISEVIWRVYQNGRASATSQNLSPADIFQLCQMAYGDAFRKVWYETEPDSRMDLIGGVLEIKEFELGEPSFDGSRRINIPDDVLRLPRGADVANLFPVSNNDCGGGLLITPTQVSPGEENFYKGAEFKNFHFFVQKGRGINTYNFPPCIKKVGVERIYASKDLDVSLDIGFTIALNVLGISLGIKTYIPTSDNASNPNKDQLKAQLEAQQSR